MTDLERASFFIKAMNVKKCRIIWDVPHALKRLVERNVPQFEAERIIRRAPGVVKVEVTPEGMERWRVSGFDSDERPIEVVVQTAHNNSALRVITVIRTDE